MENKDNSRFPMKPRHLLWIVPFGTIVALAAIALFYGFVTVVTAVGRWIIDAVDVSVKLMNTNSLALAAFMVVIAAIGSCALYAWLNASGRWQRIKSFLTTTPKAETGSMKRSEKRQRSQKRPVRPDSRTGKSNPNPANHGK